MTQIYSIARVPQSPDWTQIEKAEIGHAQWLPNPQIRAYAQLACGEDRLYVHLHADEEHIRAELHGLLDEPCQDSCLEFFFSPVETDARYLNVEINPNGCLFFGFGTGRADRTRLLLPESASMLNVRCSRSEHGWDGFYELPFPLLRLFFPDFRAEGVMRGNFYKCGDHTVQPHYLTWNPVASATPDYHRPESFGTLRFSSDAAPL